MGKETFIWKILNLKGNLKVKGGKVFSNAAMVTVKVFWRVNYKFKLQG